jgi:hypothetical protein
MTIGACFRFEFPIDQSIKQSLAAHQSFRGLVGIGILLNA